MTRIPIVRELQTHHLDTYFPVGIFLMEATFGLIIQFSQNIMFSHFID